MQANKHPRDLLIEFDAGPHKYTCAGEADYMSVTTWNHTHFKPFDADAIITKMMSNPVRWVKSPYYGQSREEIKAGWERNRDEAARLGTEMHYAIEMYMMGARPHTPHLGQAGVGEYNIAEGQILHPNGECGGYPPKYFLDFVADFPELKPYRTEWMIFDEDVRLAGSVDMVYENESDGSLLVYDWKRCKEIRETNSFGEFALTECINHLPDTNFWHYALQLNTYKAILEAKYAKKVSQMCLVCLHPSQSSYLVYSVPDLSAEMTALFSLRKNNLKIEQDIN